jgi:hypothetical protein
MKSNPEENRLQALFGELRHQDQRLAPSFERTLSAALGRKGEGVAIRIGYGGYVAAAAALVVLAVTVGMLAHHPEAKPAIVQRLPRPGRPDVNSVVEPPAMSLSNWQSPTAFLLQASDEWGQPVESPGEAGVPATQPQAQDPT